KRSLIQFDLNELPKSARIESVQLVLHFEVPIWDSLYEADLDEYMLWDDRLVFQQIVEPWEEHEVTWSNQPGSIEANQVFLPVYDHLSTNMRVYDVTCLFVPCQEIAAPNHGIMFRQPESDNPMPGGLRFASSDYSIESMRPRLIVKYSLYSR
ncbi:MAG: DNRLRE domain-containing protein, partial [Bacteroidales bacterium]|nr:DNRLRE domain-containing protein [Bacteroidales bacterium]